MDTAAHLETPKSTVSSTPSTVSLKRKRTTSTSAQDACVICLSPVSERAITVPCNHTAFDFLCLASWLQSHPRCPLCNAQVTAVQYDWCGPDDYKTYVVETPALTQKAASAPPHPRSGSGAGYGAGTSTPRRPRRSRNNEAPVTPDAALLRRRAVYRNKLYSLHVGSNRHSRYRDFTAASFAADANLQSRARAFLRRELRVFEFLDPLAAAPTPEPSTSSAAPSCGNTPSRTMTPTATTTRRANNAEFLLEYIVAILKTSAPKGGHAEELLQEFLGRENARLFLHELEAWLRSPFRRLEDWDRHVQYTGAVPYEVLREGGKGASGGRRGHGGEEYRGWRRTHWEPE
ncbi:hypothetical protein W97_06052 [Coniosporium apollinis CBS 100218]|uniref:RING-type E3 ubiquitin transferase n=1 Tax=Coniosporium apollinis (strain CBS 100218) TaxID=1168221 RepID=R7YYF1_CONA1|nr:uncharacterized protein W97_06052 [Coniosporium apollinis CBS 100218]EON66937.1 hypothetical protein W97_06052 [Coniosporium apollinis CBS 100218]